MPATQAQCVEDVLNNLQEAATDNHVSIAELMDALGTRSYGPLLLIPPLIDISPIGTIPGFPTILAILIILFAAQILLNCSHFWIPDILAKQTISARHVQRGTRAMQPIARWLDSAFHGRLSKLTKPPFLQIAAAGCILLALMVPPLEIVPLASTLPMSAIAMVGLALLVRDGLLMLAALALMFFTLIMALSFII